MSSHAQAEHAQTLQTAVSHSRPVSPAQGEGRPQVAGTDGKLQSFFGCRPAPVSVRRLGVGLGHDIVGIADGRTVIALAADRGAARGG
jgi:hypothetical protein